MLDNVTSFVPSATAREPGAAPRWRSAALGAAAFVLGGLIGAAMWWTARVQNWHEELKRLVPVR